MKVLKSENDVKAVLKDWWDKRGGWSYAPTQNGLGVHGIHDRVGVIPLVITPAMVGKTIGVFGSIEAKAPGRRGEKNRGMSSHQKNVMDAVNESHGLTCCCDGYEDLALMDAQITALQQGE